MIAKLIDTLLSVWWALIPWTVLDPYERGVLLRLGRYKRTLSPGFHWKVPFNFDTVLTCNTAPTSTTFYVEYERPYTRSVTLAVFWKIRSPKKFLLEVEDAKGTLMDLVASEAFTLGEEGWPNKRYMSMLLEHTQPNALKWGIDIVSTKIVSAVQLGLETGALRLLVSSPETTPDV